MWFGVRENPYHGRFIILVVVMVGMKMRILLRNEVGFIPEAQRSNNCLGLFPVSSSLAENHGIV